MKAKITFQQLREELERLGWKSQPLDLEAVGGTVKTHNTLFRNSKTDLHIVLPCMKPNEFVEPIYLLRVRNVLENAGFWDTLIRQTETENQTAAIRVLQTLAGIKSSR